MQTILIIIQVLIGLAMIALILVQRGSGAAAGAGFGGGASGTVFGSGGSGSFLTRTTAVLAALFLGISLFMAVVASRTISVDTGADIGVMSNLEQSADDDLPQIESAGAMDAGEQTVMDSEVVDALNMSDDAAVETGVSTDQGANEPAADADTDTDNSDDGSR